MVQEFFILKCSTCDFFQVHIVKKAKTWVCKMCGLKQSIIKVYGQGSAKECRINVQKLNEKCHSKHDSVFGNVAVNAYSNPDEDFSQPSVLEDDKSTVPSLESTRVRKSKWSAYLDEAPKQTQAPKKCKWDGRAGSKWSAYLDEVPEQTQAPKKCEWDGGADGVNEEITFSKNFEGRNQDSIRYSASRSKRSLLELIGIEPEQSGLSRLRTTEELLTSLTASSGESNVDSLSPLEEYGNGDVKYFTREVCELKADKNFSTMKSTDSRMQVTKIPASLNSEADIDSILEL